MLLSRGRLNLNRYGIISDKKADQTDLAHRMNQHKAALLYSESFENKNSAAKRERQLKGWSRAKNLELIEGCR